MATYTVEPRIRQPGYRVAVTTDDGVRHVILGFETPAEAEAWAKADAKIEQAFSTDAD